MACGRRRRAARPLPCGLARAGAAGALYTGL